MNFKTEIKKRENQIWALGLSVFLCAIIGICFDFYFDLNDDVVMKDILAGIYTGTPEGRNIQMLFPLSFILSLFYRLAGGIPWYGLFLCICHFLSIYLITNRLLGFFEKRLTKAAVLILEMGIIISLFLRELVFVQYTVTCALLAAAAAFLFFTAENETSPIKFLRKHIGSILLVTLAFQIRSEMLILVLPLICVVGLCRWAGEKKIFTKENAQKYFLVFGGILAGIILSQLINMVAYSGGNWQKFQQYFDNRTELYDFLAIPSYEDNEEFYQSIGMAESEQILLENYNFGLDEEIDEILLGKIGEYANGLRMEQASFMDYVKKAAVNYKYRTFHKTDYPWNLFVLIMYGLVLLTALSNKHFRYLWELLCLGIVRTGLWMYILYRGREPERITHSLYLMEFVILLAMLLIESGKRKKAAVIYGGVLTVLCLISITQSISWVQTEYSRMGEINKEFEALKLYTKDNAEKFYFVDVYSTVTYSEKMFKNVDNTLANYDIMGGWVSKSPLTEKKLANFDITDIEQAILEMENVYIIVQYKEPESLPQVQDWLTEYYKEKGIAVHLIKADSIAVEDREVFSVYAVEEK